MWQALGVGTLAYWVGSFPTGVVLSKWRYGIDVREMGSGNIGATNVTRTFGYYAGALTFLADFLKGFVLLYFIRSDFPGHPEWITAAGIGVVLGHCFSGYLRFRGGKGVATTLGCLAAVDLSAAILGGVVYLVILAATRISAIGSLVGILLATAYVMVREAPESVQRLMLGLAIVVLVRHRSNISRLLGDLRGSPVTEGRDSD